MYNNVFGFETDTVWGIGCDVEDIDGVNKIYEIKGRDKDKPLILMSYKIEYLLKYVEGVDDVAKGLMEKYWPGGLTLIFNKSKLCPSYMKLKTVAIRIPNHPLFKDVCEMTKNKVLATTSLNYSGETPCENYEEAKEKFQNVCEIMKPLENFKKENIPSTIVDFSSKPYKILRQGNIKINL